MEAAKNEEMVTDRNPLSLFDLSAAVVTSAMGHVEREVWGKHSFGTKTFPRERRRACFIGSGP